jgi:hypothetical protein
MTPIHDLLSRIRHDKEFGRGRFEIGYWDRRSFLPEEFHNSLSPRLHVELFIDGGQMRPHGAQGNPELVGDFLVEITLGEQRGDEKVVEPA